jgi:hypothetical protein
VLCLSGTPIARQWNDACVSAHMMPVSLHTAVNLWLGNSSRQEHNAAYWACLCTLLSLTARLHTHQFLCLQDVHRARVLYSAAETHSAAKMRNAAGMQQRCMTRTTVPRVPAAECCQLHHTL